jgi:hypothetical protein
MHSRNQLLHRSRYTAALILSLGFVTTASAQFTAFRSSAVPMQIYTMATNGTASVHNLRVSVATNGVISGSGRRFDVASTAFNANPSAGTAVSLNSRSSKLGTPTVTQTNRSIYYDGMAKRNLTNTTVTQSAAANILLTDGTRFKGIITKTRETYQYWNGQRVVTETNSQRYTSITGGAVRPGRFGFGNGYQ